MINEVGILSLAGKESGDKYNINKTKTIKKNLSSKDFSFYPDKEYFNLLKGKKQINPEEILRKTNFDINKLKKSIRDNNIYYNEEEKNLINNMKESRSKNMLKKKINNFQELVNKTQLFKGRKYKYYNEHIQRINRYKEEGIFEKILSQQESLYSPHYEYIFKKIYTGPKWDKLTGREDLFKPVKKKPNINININISTFPEKKINKRNKKIKEKNSNINIYLKKAKSAFTLKCINSLTKTQLARNKNNNTIFSNINNNKTNFTTNEFHSSLENTDKNNILLPLNIKNNILSIDNSKTSFEKNKILKLKSDKRTLKLKKNKSPNKKNDILIKKRDNLPGPDFNRYLDLEKIERKKKRLQKVAISKIVYIPNYSSIDGNIKSFVNYNIKKNTINKKPKEFIGINTSEFLYDPSIIFEKIYGYKMKSVPKFQQIKERPDDDNLLNYIKRVNGRMGLEFNSEKTLKMNNFENVKMYRSQSNFMPTKNKYNGLRKVCYESDKVLGVNKIQQDLDEIDKKFSNIKIIDYD